MNPMETAPKGPMVVNTYGEDLVAVGPQIELFFDGHDGLRTGRICSWVVHRFDGFPVWQGWRFKRLEHFCRDEPIGWLSIPTPTEADTVEIWVTVPINADGGVNFTHVDIHLDKPDASVVAKRLPDHRVSVVHARVPRPVVQTGPVDVKGEVV